MTRHQTGGYQALLFDLDGVLINSMPHHVHAWQQVFRDLGIAISGDEIRKHEGEKAKITFRRLAQEHGLDIDDDAIERLVEKKRRIYRQRAQRGLRSIARETVAICQQRGLKTAIVSGSVRPNLEWVLSQDELDLFDVIITSEFCTQGKPHAEPYLNAARRLGIQPQRCLAVENAPLGIQSAKAAGMICIAITTTLPPPVLSAADHIITDLDQIWQLPELQKFEENKENLSS